MLIRYSSSIILFLFWLSYVAAKNRSVDESQRICGLSTRYSYCRGNDTYDSGQVAHQFKYSPQLGNKAYYCSRYKNFKDVEKCKREFDYFLPYLSEFVKVNAYIKENVCRLNFSGAMEIGENVFEYKTAGEERCCMVKRRERIMVRGYRQNNFLIPILPDSKGRIEHPIDHPIVVSYKVHPSRLEDITLDVQYDSSLCYHQLTEIHFFITFVDSKNITLYVTTDVLIEVYVYYFKIYNRFTTSGPTTAVEFHRIDKPFVGSQSQTMKYKRNTTYFFYAIGKHFNGTAQTQLVGPVTLKTRKSNEVPKTGPIRNLYSSQLDDDVYLYFDKPENDTPPIYMMMLLRGTSCIRYYEMVCHDCGIFLDTEYNKREIYFNVCPQKFSSDKIMPVIMFSKKETSLNIKMVDLEDNVKYTSCVMSMNNGYRQHSTFANVTVIKTKDSMVRKVFNYIYMACGVNFFLAAVVLLGMGLKHLYVQMELIGVQTRLRASSRRFSSFQSNSRKSTFKFVEKSS